MTETVEGPDGKAGCRWAGGGGESFAYHDAGWGDPVGGVSR